MKSLRKLLVLAAMLIAVPATTSAQQIIYTICQYYDADNNCYKCSDYFSVRSEAQAKKKCKGGDPFYFPSVGALQAWMVSHCTCDHDE